MSVQPPLSLPQPINVVEANHVLAIGAYFCAADYLFARILKIEPGIRAFFGVQSAAFFYVLAAVIVVLKIGGLMRFGRSRLIVDILEICVYELLTVLFGLALFVAGHTVMPAKVLNYGLFGIMLIRLCWYFKATNGIEMATWPVFGLIGLFSKKNFIRTEVPAWHDQLVYALLMISPIFGLALVKLNTEEFGTMVASVAIILLLLQAPFFMAAKATQEPGQQPAPKSAINPGAPLPQLRAEEPGDDGALQLDSEERALVLAFRGMDAKNKPAVLNAMIALRKAFNKADQTPGA